MKVTVEILSVCWCSYFLYIYSAQIIVQLRPSLQELNYAVQQKAQNSGPISDSNTNRSVDAEIGFVSKPAKPCFLSKKVPVPLLKI